MPEENACIFCKIAGGQAQSYKLLEDKEHLAFLDVFPLVKGQTVVITKKHYSGYQFDMPDEAYKNLLMFSKKVGKKIDAGIGSERCMLVIQGYAVDHVHVKLFPVLKVNSTKTTPEAYDTLKSMLDKEWYSGYIISMSGKEQARPEELASVQKNIV